MSKSTELTNQIIDFIYRQGGYAWRQNSTGIYDQKRGIFRPGSKKGVSDILAVIPPNGRLVAVEIKIGKDRLSPEQEGFLKNVEYVGGLSFVARDLESFEEWWTNHIPDVTKMV